jgi:hypothetical protein
MEEVTTLIPETSNGKVVTRDAESPLTTTEPRLSNETSSTLPAAPAATVFPFFRLPRELRDEIYIYASLTEIVWIGCQPRLDHIPDDVIVEKSSTYKPAALVRREYSIISVCHEARDEFRTAMWREYMTGPRVVLFRVHDFDFSPFDELFANCSKSELKKLQKRDKCRVQHHITTAFHEYRRSKMAYDDIVNVLDAWMLFETRAPMDAKQSIDQCDWYDARLLRTTLEEDKITHIPDWDARWESRIFRELWDAIFDAYETRSAAHIAGRNAFHKLAPITQ